MGNIQILLISALIPASYQSTERLPDGDDRTVSLLLDEAANKDEGERERCQSEETEKNHGGVQAAGVRQGGNEYDDQSEPEPGRRDDGNRVEPRSDLARRPPSKIRGRPPRNRIWRRYGNRRTFRRGSRDRAARSDSLPWDGRARQTGSRTASSSCLFGSGSPGR